ncbi:MAG: Fic family protein [Parcubacteria group bacterium]|jgi:Fic family protein
MSKLIKIVHPQILKDIGIARASLKGDPRFDLIRRHRIYSHLEKVSSQHSVDMEKVPKGKAQKLAFENLNLAKDYLMGNCKRELSEEPLQVAAALINNYQSGKMRYRDITARTNGEEGPLVYPDPIKIPGEMYQFLQENTSLGTSVEKAVHSHFHITRIHPFEDGNGRLARLVQNCFLESSGLPAISIESFDRDFYLHLLRRATRSYQDNNGQLKPELLKFYDYIALKLRDSLLEIHAQLNRS